MPAAKPAYGDLASAVADERPEEVRRTVALVFLVAVLAVATLWYVAVPLVDRQESKPQTCDSFVLTSSGVMRCVPETTVGAPAGGPDG